MAKQAFWGALAAFILTLSMVLPLAAAAPPGAVFPAHSAGGQPITALALDAAGRFGAAVVEVDPTATALNDVTKCVSKNQGHCDVYTYDLVQAQAIAGGQHGSGLTANYRSTTSSVKQVVAAAANPLTAGIGIFVVGGPSATFSKWTTNSERPIWEASVTGPTAATTTGLRVESVAVSPQGTRFYAGANNANTGILALFLEENGVGKQKWSFDVRDAFDDATSPKITTMAYARDGKTLLVGTTAGLMIVDATVDAALTKDEPPARGAIGSSVAAIAVTHDSKYAAVAVNDATTGQSGFVYLLDLQDCSSGRCDLTRTYSSTAQGRANAVGITKDGKLFAVGSGSGKVIVHRRDGPGTLSVQLSTITLDGPVQAVRFNADGTVLVAATAKAIYGLHPTRSQPLWTLDAQTAGLDAPILDVQVGDAGERIIAAGKTKVAAFKQVFAAEATLDRKTDVANPGDAKKYTLTVENKGSIADEYDVRVTPPAGWRVDGEARKSVLPSEKNTFNFTITTPTTETPGPRDVVFDVRSLGIHAKKTATGASTQDKQLNEFIVSNLKLNYTVVAVRDNIRLEAESSTVSVNQEEDTSLAFTVRNLGNSAAQVNFTVSQDNPRGTQWTARFDHDQLTVQPGGRAGNALTIQAPPEAANGETNTLTVRASVGARELNTLKFTARVNPSFAIDLTTADGESLLVVKPAEPTIVKLLVRNKGNTQDKVNLTVDVQPEAARLHWRAVLSTSVVDLRTAASKTVDLTIRATDSDPLPATITVTATSQGGGDEIPLALDVELLKADKESAGSGILPTPGLPAPMLLGALLVAGLALAGRRAGNRQKPGGSS